MLDLAFVRNNLELVEQKLSERGGPTILDGFRELDQKRRQTLTEVETLKNRRNRAGDEIARRKRDKQDTQELLLEMKAVAGQIKSLDEQVREHDALLKKFLENLPNLPHSTVPVGANAEWNQEMRRWGEPRFRLARTGSWASRAASWTWTGQPKLPEPALRFTGTWGRSSKGRWPTSC